MPAIHADLRHVRFTGAPTGGLRLPPTPARGPVTASVVPGTTDLPQHSGADGLPGYVLDRCGLDPHVYRRRPLDRRVAACLRALKVDSQPAARALLDDRPELLRTALDALLIGVSAFFRDTAVFEAVQTTVVPEMRRRATPLRVWSAGCSTGAELYSVAMLLAEAGLLDRALLLGTDCRPDIVDRARTGLFDDASLAGVDEALRRKYLERVPGGWRPSKALRQRSDWGVSDAARSVPEGPWDLVLCRNVAIYFETPAAELLFTRIAGTLSPGGFLTVGKAERPPSRLKLSAVARCVYRRADG